jgi:DNA-directed RNA polymerase subunit H (RpoH/RPB5)
MPSPRTRSRKTSKSASAQPPPPPRPFTAHHLVPPHELLSESEGQKVLEELGTSLERLPKILVADPGLKTDQNYVKAREAHEPLAGRLVRVRRPSATAGEAIAFRVIINNVGE